MGALPKRKIAKARQGKRRSHLSLSKPNLESCPQCHSPKLPHHVCPTCGSYRGKEIVKVKETSTKS
ncbi:MAG: 50S ribosomal protein L32 [Dehalococcoidia bacterium]|nr:50S ribosomal protein L32 [Dehalococcoidia bacterium]